MSTTSLADASAARDLAIGQVADAADPDWLTRALAAVGHLARIQPEITTDDLWSQIEPPAEPRAAGPVMLAAARAGLIEHTDQMRMSARRRNHRRPLRVWRSLMYRTELEVQ